MDDVYQLMCKKAIIIQESWSPRVGDVISMCQPNHMNDKVIDIVARKKYDDKILDFSPDLGEYDEDWLEKPTKIFTDYWSRRFSNQWFGIENFEIIWLPRQDQLQEMLINSDFTYLVDEFQIWVYQQRGFYYNQINQRDEKLFKSMEQLWLGFVMEEKFNKVWNGKDWN